MRTVRFGIIGCGLMGREFASAVARWSHLPDMDARPELVAVCDPNPETIPWFRNFTSIRQITGSYRELLANREVDAVYVAVPHDMHQEIYCAAVEAGKHLLGEKPFGIDLPANEAITETVRRHPECFVRCSSEFPFYPAAQRIGRMIDEQVFGTILEVNSGLLHSSDLNPRKPINWKRTVARNGEYGCLGDLGMHACHMVFRAGWMPLNVRALLENVIRERPDSQGKMVPCDTWDNATLLCECWDPVTGGRFPWTMKAWRIAPGEKNTWYFEILGTRSGARFCTRNPALLEIFEYDDGGVEQTWKRIPMGQDVAFRSITGAIFECGFSDVLLQMWAAFVHELHHGTKPSRFAGCVTPEEAALSHRLFTAALESQRTGGVVSVRDIPGSAGACPRHD